ncbi:MAG: hypothetical protein EOM17_10865 [Synergistales bacterium]|nr:hypothetical protein [Synergistales bacterium]
MTQVNPAAKPAGERKGPGPFTPNTLPYCASLGREITADFSGNVIATSDREKQVEHLLFRCGKRILIIVEEGKFSLGHDDS